MRFVGARVIFSLRDAVDSKRIAPEWSGNPCRTMARDSSADPEGWWYARPEERRTRNLVLRADIRGSKKTRIGSAYSHPRASILGVEENLLAYIVDRFYGLYGQPSNCPCPPFFDSILWQEPDVLPFILTFQIHLLLPRSQVPGKGVGRNLRTTRGACMHID